MLVGPSDALKEAIAALWQLRAPGPENLLSAPSFVRLQSICSAEYGFAVGKLGPTFALSNALRWLGLPCGLPAAAASLALPAAEAATKLDEAFRRRSSRRLHLCPLDTAGPLPSLEFGQARLGRFSVSELRDLVDAARLDRVHAPVIFDADRFSEFQWLVVEEVVPFDEEPEARAMPGLYRRWGEDLGRIEPHQGRFPKAVEDALFFLLLAPWDEWAEMKEVDWRGFRIPWVFTVEDDLFVRPPAAPSPETLSWTWDYIRVDEHETIEVERPVALPLSEASVSLRDYNTSAWAAVVAARESPLFEAPVGHFFVRAFLADEMDEFLAHLTAIEASLGLRSDFRGDKKSPRKRLSATQRMAARISALLGDVRLGEDYERLFDLRSAYLHGRSMGPISTIDRILARKLARQVVSALVVSAVFGGAMARDKFLDSLLDRGSELVTR